MTTTDRGPRLFGTIAPRNLLSFGPDTEPIELKSLNVLIGPNGSGKSNLIEAITLLRAAPGDLRDVIRQGGGVTEWVWKGQPMAPASVEATVANPKGNQDLRHFLSFRAGGQAFRLEDERIENREPHQGQTQPYFYYRYQQGRPAVNVAGHQRRLELETVDLDASILAQRRDPEQYPEITYLASTYQKIRVYREWIFGRNAVFRGVQKADMRNDRLEEDFSNLGLFLNRLRRHPKAKDALLAALRDLYDGIRDFDVSVEAGTVQVFLTEQDFVIPATRLSDGTLRYLCLLAILCDPEPPPLICIEEPELGLHPDLLPKIADLLIAASERTQLIVTTHSDILVDAMTECPEAVLVCEKREGQSTIRRLDADQLKAWLEKYSLGQLWTRGQLGGTRW
jgi:predicted ATPase